jgi:single-strand DNA-binding protein
MYETTLTIVGRLATAPVLKRVGDSQVATFRLATNSRKRMPDGSWEPGRSLFLSVNCWGKLGTGVAGSLGKGDAVIVTGHVYTSEYDDREGIRRSSLEMRANAVGPDLSHYVVKVGRVVDNDLPGLDEDRADDAVSEDAQPSGYDLDAYADDLAEQPDPVPA